MVAGLAGLAVGLSLWLTRAPPSLVPVPLSTARFIAVYQGWRDRWYKDAAGRPTIGYGHVLTPPELNSGVLVIGGKAVFWRHEAITVAQGVALLSQDIASAQQAVKKLVKVKLTANQLAALTSFVYNVGPEPLRQGSLLNKLNAGKYDEVPKEMMKWVRAGNVVLPGLVAERRAEVARWNKK